MKVLICLLFFCFSAQLFGCFSIVKVPFVSGTKIDGVTVNHRIVFYDVSDKLIESIKLLKVINLKTKKMRKSCFV